MAWLPCQRDRKWIFPVIWGFFRNLFLKNMFSLLEGALLPPNPKGRETLGWDSPKSKLYYLNFWLVLTLWKTLLEEKTVTEELGESHPLPDICQCGMKLTNNIKISTRVDCFWIKTNLANWTLLKHNIKSQFFQPQISI